jgi:hypothetical protein
MPKDALVELLRHLASNENFNSVEELNSEDLPVELVRSVLRELSNEIAKEAALEGKPGFDVKGSKVLSKASKNVISCLSTREEKALLSKFGLNEEKNK